jgi:hypothetical protein
MYIKNNYKKYAKNNFYNILFILIFMVISIIIYVLFIYSNKFYFNINDRRVNKNKLRIMQYNVEYLFLNYDNENNCPGKGCTWKSNQDIMKHLEFISNIIKKLNPDIVNLCEIQNYNSLQGILNYLSPSYKGYFINDYTKINNQNIGLISRIAPNKLYKSNYSQLYPIIKSNCNYNESRNYVNFYKHYVAEFYINNINIVLIGVHLKAFFDSESCSKKEAQAEIIRNIIFNYKYNNKYGFAEFIVIGDLNEYDNTVLDNQNDKSKSNVFKILEKECKLINATKKIKKKNRISNKYIDKQNNVQLSLLDYVLVSKNLYSKISNIFIYNTFNLNNKYNSDHLPLIVDFEFH